MKIKTTIILLLIWRMGHSQNVRQCTVVDSITAEPISFAHVFNTNTDDGTITNELGHFKLDSKQSDLLRISFLGYREKTLQYNHLINDTIKLAQLANTLTEITISAKPKDLYDIIKQSKDKLNRNRTLKACKAYMHVNTVENSKPIEFTQVYYNATIENSSIKNLAFKNGASNIRSNKNGGWFLNLNMSKAFSLYNLVRPNKSLPINPFQLSHRKLKNRFHLVEGELIGDIIRIEFSPKKEGTKYGRGTIWINKNDFSLMKLQIAGDNKNKTFSGVGNTFIKGLKYLISYNFIRHESEVLINYISLVYNAEIKNETTEIRNIETEAILHLTKYDESYHKPHFNFQEGISDYRAISLVPDTIIFNAISDDGQILLSPIQKENLNQLKSYGVSFQDSEFGDDFFENNYNKWNKERIILKKTTKKINTNNIRNIEDRIDRYGFETDKLNIETQLYFDHESTKEGLQVESCAILDIYNSFNHLTTNNALQAYVNIYFDIAEIYRRKFVRAIKEKSLTIDEIKRLYYKHTSDLKLQQENLKKEAFAGKSLINLKKWSDLVYDELGVDNFKLFNLIEEMTATNNR